MSNSTAQSRRPRRRRWLWLAILTLVLIGVTAFLAMQIVLWTNVPRRIVVAQVQRQLGLRITAGSVSTGWFGNTHLRDVVFALPLSDQPLLEIPLLRVRHTSLVPLLLGTSFDLDVLEFDRPILHAEQDHAGQWNVLSAIATARRSLATPREPASRNRPQRLPEVHIADGQIALVGRNGSATIQPVTVTTQRTGPLLYRYEIDLQHGQLHLTGQVVPQNPWAHQLQFTAHDLERVLATIATIPPGAIELGGSWTGKLAGDGVEGRLESASVTAAEFAARGAADIRCDGRSNLEVRPDAVMLRAAGEETRLTGGVIRIENATVFRADQLVVAARDGLAILSGQWNPLEDSAWVKADWRQIQLAAGVTIAGKIDARLQSPLGRPQISASIIAAADTEAGAIDTSLHIAGNGESFDAIDWTADIAQFNIAGKRTINARRLSAQLRTRGSRIVLDQFAAPDFPALAARGEIDLASLNWWLWTAGENLPLPHRAKLPFAFNVNAWGQGPYVKLSDGFFRAGDLDVTGEGFYDARLPKPVNLQIHLLHLPPQERQASYLLKGDMVGQMELVGTLRPGNISLLGELHGSNVRLRHREIGQVSAQLTGQADETGVRVATLELQLLGGRWEVAGEWPAETDRPSVLKITVKNLPAEELAQLLGRASAGGVVNGELRISPAELELNQLRATGRLDAQNLTAGPLACESAEARIRLRDGQLRIDPVILRQADSTVNAELAIALDRPDELRVEMTAKDWPMQVGNVAARISGHTDTHWNLPQRSATGPMQATVSLSGHNVPPSTVRLDANFRGQSIFARSIGAELYGGTVNGSGVLDWAQPLQSSAELNWQNIDAAQLAALHPRLDGLGGAVAGSVHLSADDRREALGPLRLDVAFNMDGGQYRGMEIRDGKLAAFFGRDRIVTDGAQFNVAAGTVALFARATRHEGEALSTLVTIDFGSVDLNQVVHAVTPAAEAMPGKLSGRFTAAGDPHQPGAMFGEGSARLVEADLINFDPIGAVYNLMNVVRPRGSPSGVAGVEARLEGGELFITEARIFDRGTEVRGQATIKKLAEFPDSPLEGVAVGAAKPLAQIRLPFFADVDQIFSVLQENLTTVRVDGTVSQPHVVPATFADIGQNLRQLLLGEVKPQNRN